MSTLGLSREFELRQKICWGFKWKRQQAMASSLTNPLQGTVHVDEFFVGGLEEQKRGRTKGEKKLIVLAIEITKEGVGRTYSEIIENDSSKELGMFIKKYVTDDAKIITDEWTGYAPLQKEYQNLMKTKSESSMNFKDIHITS